MNLVNLKDCYSGEHKYEDIDNGNEHVVIYSGGCDSTLMLYEIAKEYGTKEKPVIALSYNHHAPCPVKAIIEKKTRESFRKYCKKNKIYINFTEVSVGIKAVSKRYFSISHHPGIVQPYLWLGALGVAMLGWRNFYFGYIKHDDFWMFKSEFVEAFKALQKVIMTENKVFFPLMDIHKENIIRKLKEYEIYDLTWHCETPTKEHEACGTCTPCKKHKEALRNLLEEAKETKKMHEELKEKVDELESIKEVEHA